MNTYRTIRTVLALLAGIISAELSYASSRVVTIVGGQFGDEGKGKIVDYLSASADFVVRAQGGNNAGHTVKVGDNTYKFHLIPSGILHESCQCVIGAGVVIDPIVFGKEVQTLQEKHGIAASGRVWISPAANVIMPYHCSIDKLMEKAKGAAAIGTTGRGIGPCYTDKANRMGIRVADLFHPERLEKRLAAIVPFVNNQMAMLRAAAQAAMSQNKEVIPAHIASQLVDLTTSDHAVTIESLRAHCIDCANILKPFMRPDLEQELFNAAHDKAIILEGAQGTFLDVTFGMVPFVTSSSTIAAGICGGAGLGPTHVGTTLIVVKAYTTRVGNGPFPTQVNDDQAFLSVAGEVGTATGRTRRVGWFDAALVKKSVMLNGANYITLTKIDVLDSLATIKICVGYECDGVRYDLFPADCADHDRLMPIYEEMPGWLASTKNIRTFDALPEQAQNYCRRIEQLCGAPLAIVSVGPERTQTIVLNKLL